jgi:O-acetylserine/cysteine efflux transporter
LRGDPRPGLRMKVPPGASGEHPEEVAPRHLALLVAMNLIWGLNLVACKVGVGHFPPIFFTALRFAVLGALLLPWLRLHRGEMRNLIAAAVLTGPVTFALMFVGIARVHEVSTVAVINQLGVPFSTLLSVWLLGERIRWRRRLGIALAFAGVVVISFDPRVLVDRDGLGLLAVSAFAGALGVIFIKTLRTVRPLELQAWVSASGAVVLLAMSLSLESGQVDSMRAAGPIGWSALAYTVFLASLVAHTSWYWLVGRYPVTRLAALTPLTPLFGILFGVTVLGDELTSRMVAGSAITLAGVYIVVRREQRIFDTGT